MHPRALNLRRLFDEFVKAVGFQQQGVISEPNSRNGNHIKSVQVANLSGQTGEAEGW